MKKRFSWIVLIVSVLLTALITFQTTFILTYVHYSGNQAVSNDIASMDMLAAVEQTYKNYYYGEIDQTELEKGLIEGYIYGTGDKYGMYMDADTYADFEADSKGESIGVGITVIANDDMLMEIVSVTENSPAANSGVTAGDIIIKIGGKDAAEMGYDGALAAMLGEEGTTAEFTVLRGDEEIDFSIVRQKVEKENVKGRLYSDGVTGILRIEQFDTNTSVQFTAEIERLQKEGAERIVFDVRGNPGGDLECIVEVLDYLLPEGPIIRIEYASGETETRTSDKENRLDIPMVVLINENTASAAELFASALKDYEAATLVGKTTYGKGSMQGVLPLINGSMLKLTTAVYMPPYSESYDGIGVVPHIDVDMTDDVKNVSIYKLADEEDTQLMRAIESFDQENN